MHKGIPDATPGMLFTRKTANEAENSIHPDFVSGGRGVSTLSGLSWCGSNKTIARRDSARKQHSATV